MAKAEVFGKVAGLLNKFQGRLDSLRSDVSQIKRRAGTTDDQLAILAGHLHKFAEKTVDAHRMATDALLDHETQKSTNRVINEKFEDPRIALNKTSKLALDIAGKVNASSPSESTAKGFEDQAAVNKEVAESLYKLRDSIQTSFNAVRGDMEKMFRTVQHANVRAGEVESQHLALIARISLLENHIANAETNSKIARDVFALLRSAFQEPLPGADPSKGIIYDKPLPNLKGERT